MLVRWGLPLGVAACEFVSREGCDDVEPAHADHGGGGRGQTARRRSLHSSEKLHVQQVN